MKRIRAFLAVCVVATCASVLQSAPVYGGGTLIIGQAGEPDSLDPPAHSNDFSSEVIRMVFENLVRFAEHAGSLDLEPALATRWEQAQDGLSWSFDLREGVAFHDGTPFNSDAVVHFFEERVFGGDRPAKAWPLFGDLVTGVDAQGPYRVTIHLARPHAYFLERLAHQGAAIGSPEAYRKHGAEVAFQPVGTGPFRFVEAERGNHITLEANPDYWRGAPNLDRVVVRPVREAGTRALQIEAGQVHVTSALPDEIVPRLEANPNVEVIARLSNMAIRMDLNTARAPLDDVRVRQALNLAVDKAAIADFLFGGSAVVIPGGVSPVTRGFFDFRGWDYDPEAARALLAEAGYPDGFRMSLWGPGTGAIPKDLAIMETLQQMFAEIGVTLDIEVMEWSTISREARRPLEENQSWSTLQRFPPSTGEATWMLNFLTSGMVPPLGSNRSFYANPVFDDLLEQSTSATDPRVRDEMLRAAQLVLHEDAVLVPMVTPRWIWAQSAGVSDMVYSPVMLSFADERTSLAD